MVKIEFEIPEWENEIMAKIAKKLGSTVQALLQQEIDRNIETISVWVQRGEMLDH